MGLDEQGVGSPTAGDRGGPALDSSRMYKLSVTLLKVQSATPLKWGLRAFAIAFGFGGLAFVLKAGLANPLAVGTFVGLIVIGVAIWYITGKGDYGPPVTRCTLDRASIRFEFEDGESIDVPWNRMPKALTIEEVLEVQDAGSPPRRVDARIRPPGWKPVAFLSPESFDGLVSYVRSVGLEIAPSHEDPDGEFIRRSYRIAPRDEVASTRRAE